MYGDDSQWSESMEALRPQEVERLVSELRRSIEQLLSIDPNGMLRIHQVVHEVNMARVVEMVVH